MNNDRHRIKLNQRPGGSQEAIYALQQLVAEFCAAGFHGAVEFVKGVGQTQTAKAAELEAKAMAEIAKVDLEHEKLILEREKAEAANEQRMLELQIQRRNDLINHLIRMKEMGIDVDLEIVAKDLVKDLVKEGLFIDSLSAGMKKYLEANQIPPQGFPPQGFPPE